MFWLVCLLCGACASASHVEKQPVGDPPDIDRTALESLSDADFASGGFISEDGIRLRYRLLPPIDPKSGMRYPLVLVLHGSGAIGDDNHNQLGPFSLAWALPVLRSRYPAYVLVPQFPIRSANYDTAATPWIAHETPALSAAMALVDKLAAEHAVDPTRIYATGFSMGGSASWLAPLLRPDLFAAAMPIAGIAPDRSEASRLTALPLQVLHGDADTENPIDADRAMVAQIRAAGGKRVHLREYEGLDHRVADDILLGTWWRDWLFAQRRPAR